MWGLRAPWTNHLANVAIISYSTVSTNGKVKIQGFSFKGNHAGIAISLPSAFGGDKLGIPCLWWPWWERLTCKAHRFTSLDCLLMPLHFCLALVQVVNIPSKQRMKEGLQRKQGHGDNISGGFRHRVTFGVYRHLTCLFSSLTPAVSYHGLCFELNGVSQKQRFQKKKKNRASSLNLDVTLFGNKIFVDVIKWRWGHMWLERVLL